MEKQPKRRRRRTMTRRRRRTKRKWFHCPPDNKIDLSIVLRRFVAVIVIACIRVVSSVH